MQLEQTRIKGIVVARLYDEAGDLTAESVTHNLITDTGDLYYATRGQGGTPPAPTGMRLGTNAAAPTKNGAGAAIGTYVAGSNRPLDATFPTVAAKAPGTGARITWQCTWGAGVATANGLAEVVLTNETPLTDVAGSAATALARALLLPTVNKGANDTLVVTWYHDFLGA